MRTAAGTGFEFLRVTDRVRRNHILLDLVATLFLPTLVTLIVVDCGSRTQDPCQRHTTGYC